MRATSRSTGVPTAEIIAQVVASMPASVGCRYGTAGDVQAQTERANASGDEASSRSVHERATNPTRYGIRLDGPLQASATETIAAATPAATRTSTMPPPIS
jgi:hypothetical protein